MSLFKAWSKGGLGAGPSRLGARGGRGGIGQKRPLAETNDFETQSYHGPAQPVYAIQDDELPLNQEFDAVRLSQALSEVQYTDTEITSDQEFPAEIDWTLKEAQTAVELADYNDIGSEYVNVDAPLFPVADADQARAADDAIEEDVDINMMSVATIPTAATSVAPNPVAPITSTNMLPPSAMGVFSSGDTSEPFHDFPGSVGEISDMELSFGLLAHQAGMSRAVYTSLHQILAQSTDPRLTELPMSLETVRKHTRQTIPLVELRRKKDVPLVAARMPTAAEGDKDLPETSPKENLYFFNPDALFVRILAAAESDLDKLYFGMGKFVDTPLELWESNAWTSSIRTTSGEFARYPKVLPCPILVQKRTGKTSGCASNAQDTDWQQFIGEADGPIFPSDFVLYQCDKPIQAPCNFKCKAENGGSLHTGRVLAVGLDKRGDATADAVLMVKVQRIAMASLTPTTSGVELCPPAHPREMVVWEQIVNCVPPNQVFPYAHGKIGMWYEFESRDGKGKSHPLPGYSEWFIRRIYNPKIDQKIRPAWQVSPIRGELEILEFGRDSLVGKFDTHSTGIPVKSMPLINFIDGFGLYRNMYRSLMGFYFIMASMTFQERARRANVIPFTLGPHGSNMRSVVDAIGPMLRELDSGKVMHIPTYAIGAGAQKTLVCAFTFYYIGDMPQQQENSGMKSQNAAYGCRLCLVPSNDRGNLQYDHIVNGRFHHENERARRYMMSLSTQTDREKQSSATGMDLEKPPLQDISPALDVLHTRPGDPTHSEYGGLTHLLHRLLIDFILTKPAQAEYAGQLRMFPFPPGYSRLQSPQHHLASYSLSEHAEWSIIIAPLLRFFLQDNHIRKDFVDTIRLVMADQLNRLASEAGVPSGDITSSALVVRTFALVARSNMNLMSTTLTAIQREDFEKETRAMRTAFQQMMESAAKASTRDPASKRPTPRPTRRNSVASEASAPAQASTLVVVAPRSSSAEILIDVIEKDTIRSIRYRKDNNRPNVHAAVHYKAMAQEYGSMANCNVLIGEDKHRQFKKDIYHTNNINPERDLLLQQQLEASTRLILQGGFPEPEFERIVEQMEFIYKKSPALLEDLLPRSEQSKNQYDENADELVKSDDNHRHVVAGDRISPVVCSENHMPNKTHKMSKAQQNELTAAYLAHYGINIAATDSRPVRWFQRLSFWHKDSQQRVVLRLGDFIKYTSSDQQSGIEAIGRIKHIFSHTTIHGDQRIFVRVTRVSGKLDPASGRLLNDPFVTGKLLQYDGHDDLVGLPQVGGERLWVLPFVRDPDSFYSIKRVKSDQATELMWMDWDLTFL